MTAATDTTPEMVAAFDQVELTVARDLTRKALLVVPLACLALGLWRGLDAAAAVAAACVIVLINFFVSALLMRWGARHGPEWLMGAVLGGFLIKIIVLFCIGLALKPLDVLDWTVFCLALVVTHLGLLAWETRAVSLTLAYPSLKPRPHRASSARN
jgi:hypothetical protein